MNKTRLGALAPLILALAACGGGSGDGPAVFQPGEVLTFAATLDDGSTQETRYLVHAVTADGDLVAGESTAKLSPHRPPLASVRVALPLEAGDTPQDNAARLAALRDFYKQLWQGIAERRNDGSDIAAEIGAFESDVGVLYDDYRQSEFASVKDYVAFYEQVGENPYFDAQESVEEELVQFFAQTGWSQGAWLRALQAQNTDWPRFLALMAQRGDSFASLLHQYKTGNSSGLDDFVAGYVNSPRIKIQTKANPWKQVDGFYIRNPSWMFWMGDFPSTSSAPGAREASIISPADVHPYTYQVTSWDNESCPTKVHLSGRANVLHAFLAYYVVLEVANQSRQPMGVWVPRVAIDVLGVDKPDGGMHNLIAKNIEGAAEITDVKNVGTAERPQPRFNVVTKLKIPRLYNSKVWKITHAIDLDAWPICSTLSK